ncbi:MAG: STAS domain-containing protein [Spirochaetes bacterium]|jgi:anti-sigma B factor antagonist|nr:STAS domain-containing protein [Spirochaetota bacterium]
MEFAIVSKSSAETEIKVIGDCTIYNAQQIKTFLDEHYFVTDHLVLNLAGVDEVDSSFFQLLVAIKKDATRIKKRVSYISHSLPVLKYIDLYGAAALLGDRIVVKKEDREKFDFKYGLKIVKGEPSNESR